MLSINYIVVPILSKLLDKLKINKTVAQFVTVTSGGVLKFGLALVFIDMVGISIVRASRLFPSTIRYRDNQSPRRIGLTALDRRVPFGVWSRVRSRSLVDCAELRFWPLDCLADNAQYWYVLYAIATSALLLQRVICSLGDWVCIADSSIEGEVIKIGLTHV